MAKPRAVVVTIIASLAALQEACDNAAAAMHRLAVAMYERRLWVVDEPWVRRFGAELHRLNKLRGRL